MKYYETEELKNLMDYVGKTLMGTVDELYDFWLGIFQSENKLSNENEINARELYQRLPEVDRKILLSILRYSSFSLIHYLLHKSEDSQAELPDALYFAARKDNVEYPNISYQSDGLCGEMHLDDGWYELFSKYAESDDKIWLK